LVSRFSQRVWNVEERLVSGHVVLGPNWKATTFRSGRILHAERRVDLDVAGVERPPEDPSHCVEKIPALRRSLGSAVAAGDDVRALDRGGRFVTSLRQHADKDVFALALGSRGQAGPCARFAIAVNEPRQRADRHRALARL
jgi:hypothetical protein